MNFRNMLLQLYFDLVYNPVYDISTGRFSAYRDWQKQCVDKFRFEDGDSMLCVGIGTGNEIPCILTRNRKIEIVGVDFSERALRRAYQKSLKQGRELKAFKMDAQNLQYPSQSFDKVLCIHVMDFIEDDVKASREILRVLKNGGQFVITYPLSKDGVKLGANILRDNLRQNINSRKYWRALGELLAEVVVGITYLPFLFRAKQRSYSYQDLEAIFAKLKPAYFQIERYPLYSDFIVYGRK